MLMLLFIRGSLKIELSDVFFINFMALFSIFSGIREAFTGCGRRNFEKSDFSGCGPLRGRCMHVLAIAASANEDLGHADVKDDMFIIVGAAGNLAALGW